MSPPIRSTLSDSRSRACAIFSKPSPSTGVFASRPPTTFGATEGELADTKLKLKLSFASDVTGLTNERTGRSLGNGRTFEDDYTPWEANVYTYTPK